MECVGYLLEELRNPETLEEMRKDVETANIFIGSLIFIQVRLTGCWGCCCCWGRGFVCCVVGAVRDWLCAVSMTASSPQSQSVACGFAWVLCDGTC